MELEEQLAAVNNNLKLVIQCHGKKLLIMLIHFQMSVDP